MNQQAWDITLEHLDGGYDGRIVLKDFSAVIPAGTITTILGESGCGKTTLLRLLLGLNRPYAGSIRIGGRDVCNMSETQFRKMRRRFGVLFQDGALISSLTLAENVALPLVEHTKLPPKTLREAALRTLALVGLEKFGSYYPGELSGGMRKRAGLARAIVTEPPVLFCDEPTSGLDPITAAQMDQLLLDMKACYPSMTTVVVTHDLGSVEHIAEHVLVLQNGRAAFSGSKEELHASQDPYLRRFLDRKFEESRRMAAPPLDSSVRKALAEWLDD